MTTGTGLFKAQRELSDRLDKCGSDKERVRLLMETLEKEERRTFTSIGIWNFAFGYLQSLLTRHGLNDWE